MPKNSSETARARIIEDKNGYDRDNHYLYRLHYIVYTYFIDVLPCSTNSLDYCINNILFY